MIAASSLQMEPYTFMDVAPIHLQIPGKVNSLNIEFLNSISVHAHIRMNFMSYFEVLLKTLNVQMVPKSTLFPNSK